MKASNVKTRNTEKDIKVDLNVHFFLPCFPDQTFIIQDCSIGQTNLLEEDDNLVMNE